MDPQRFDVLARALSSSTSRRSLFKRTASGLGASALAFIGMSPLAKAKPTACGSSVCKGQELCCPIGDAQACVDPKNDPKNCGACGNSCPEGSACRHGRCTCISVGKTCSTDDQCCSGFCEPQSGQCVELCNDPGFCPADDPNNLPAPCGNGCGCYLAGVGAIGQGACLQNPPGPPNTGSLPCEDIPQCKDGAEFCPCVNHSDCPQGTMCVESSCCFQDAVCLPLCGIG
jgi:hypothetical protein